MTIHELRVGESASRSKTITETDVYPVSYTHLDVYKRQVRADGWIGDCLPVRCRALVFGGKVAAGVRPGLGQPQVVLSQNIFARELL